MTAGSFADAIKDALKNWPADFAVAWLIDMDPIAGRPATTVRVTGAGEGRCEHVRLAYGSSGPTGLFAGKVNPAPVRNLAQALSQVDFEALRGGVPAGAAPVLVEVLASGQGAVFSIDSLNAFPEARSYCEGVLSLSSQALATQPAAAVALELSVEGNRATIHFRKLGSERLLLGNPIAAGSKAILKLQVLRPPDAARNVAWDLLDLPLAETAFDGRPRWFELDAGGLAVSVELPASSPALTAGAVRAVYSDPEPTPALRVGLVEVFARSVVSNAIERAS